jgi:hypothetical protein
MAKQGKRKWASGSLKSAEVFRTSAAAYIAIVKLPKSFDKDGLRFFVEHQAPEWPPPDPPISN